MGWAVRTTGWEAEGAVVMVVTPPNPPAPDVDGTGIKLTGVKPCCCAAAAAAWAAWAACCSKNE